MDLDNNNTLNTLYKKKLWQPCIQNTSGFSSSFELSVSIQLLINSLTATCKFTDAQSFPVINAYQSRLYRFGKGMISDNIHRFHFYTGRVLLQVVTSAASIMIGNINEDKILLK